jgi:leader peptidase (prepilin peptidase)/N-methyltransferase
VVELTSGLFTLFVYQKWGISLSAFFYLIFLYALIVISFIDLKWQIIPDVISLPGILLGLTASFFLPLSFKDAFLGALLGGGVLFFVAYGYYFITKKEGMGGGDIKLLAMIGAFLGWQAVPFVLFIASLMGSIIGIIWLIATGKDRHCPIPFGPFLALGAICVLFYPQLLFIL